MTRSAELLQAADPAGALKALTDEIKAKPADSKLRVFMAQLLCVLGQWERAHTQLNVVADMDPSAGPMREMVGHALRCELLRAAVFEGRRAPMVFGQPDEWLALLIESLLQSKDDAAQAAHLAERAFEAAPAMRGQFNGQPFEWIADADSRLGPVLEAMVNGRYYWVPFSHLSQLRLEEPVDLRDKVWVPAQLQFRNGGETVALVPTRYADTDLAVAELALARRTEWREPRPGFFTGQGQRLLTTEAGDLALLDLREITFADGEPA